MKKRLLMICSMCLFVISALAQTEVFQAFVHDSNGPTNVRNGVKGKIVTTISQDAIVFLVSPTNGWWRIVDDEYWSPDDDTVELKGSKTGYWIHCSVIAVSTRNYGQETLYLRASPNGKAGKVFAIKEEMLLRPIDIKGDWVKVRTMDGKHSGWIESEWLCGNSVTTCS